MPSIYNATRPTLESDLVRLDILFVNAFYLSTIIFTIIQWQHHSIKNNLVVLLNKLWFFLIPLTALIISQYIYLSLSNSSFTIFGNIRGNVAEIIFIFAICSIALKNNILRIVLSILIGAFLLELGSRSYIIPFGFLFVMLIIFPGLRLLKLSSSAKWILLAFIIFITMIFWQSFMRIADHIFLLSDSYRGMSSSISGRVPVWNFAIESIKSNPWAGIGYWVNPMGYSVPDQFPAFSLNNPAFVTHNAFIRIFTENGLILSSIILCTIGTAFYRMRINNQPFDILITIAILFSLSFTTRHLTLNLLNVILYFIIVNAMCKKNHRQESS
tara:strand:+ start:988 stop:1971 length:984 start_codon:yes stop_codon:yes gene_type:complete